MSSTFLIQPIDNDQHLKSADSISPTSIKNSTLSRLFDMPVDLLDNTDSRPAFNSIADEQAMFWAPASKHLELTPAEFDASTITHSFANRKRSFVKRRKSVLSSSFTPDDEDEQETIKNDREATLAALERRSMQPIKEGTSKKMDKSLRRSISLTLPNSTPDYDISDIQGSPVLLFHRGSLLRRGEKSKFRRRSSCDPPSRQPNSIEKEQEQDEQEDKESIENQELSSIAQVSPKDSVIDLCSTEESQLEEEEEDSSSNTVIDDSSTKIINLSLNTEKTEEHYKIPTPPPSPPLVALTSEKKSKKSWSRRLFSTKSKKMHDPMRLGVDEMDRPSVDDIDDGRPHNGGKFNFSSLFSSKKYSSYGSLRKKKSSASSSSSSGLERNSPYSSSTDTLVPPKDVHLANFNYTRLPIHTERAVYRLSHIKLTHPRRPLRDQVMISNLMFWYLSVINQPGCNTNNEIEQPDNTLYSNNNSDSFCNAKNSANNSMALIKKAYGIPTTGTNKARGFKKRSNKRLRQQSTRSANSNAMDLIKKSGGDSKSLSQRRYTRTSNSSSEESDGDDDDDISLTDEDEDIDSMIIIKEEEKKPKKKYSLFKYAKGNNHSNGASSWLPSFSSPKPPSPRQDEDDIPLAMYKKSRF
ncbi:hypothetical protein K501DRAFT_268814 [Backusella circina FSU 941]|nr:hypothetical protein K501DRAFT_268814 [Backusella circina FSU 941]